MTTTLQHPGPRAGCQRASLVVPSRALAEREANDMNPKKLAVTLYLAAAITTNVGPATAHRRAAGRNPQPELVRTLIARYFPAHARARAYRVAKCESGLDPRALGHNRNGTHDVGIFQLNSGGTIQSLGITVAQAADPATNVAAAARLYKRRGWQPWVCSGRRR